MGHSILIIEEDKKITDFLQRGLAGEGYSIDVANSWALGHFLASSNNYDLIIMSVMVPKTEGLMLCMKLLEEKIAAPMLVLLVAKNAVLKKIMSIPSQIHNGNAKSFGFDDMLARIGGEMKKAMN